MDNVIEIIQEQAKDALQRLGIQGVVTAEDVSESVIRQAVYCETPLPSGEKLLFIRLVSPVVEREEVFLGSILFNAFLSKAFPRALVHAQLGMAELVANDLENFYFLVRTTNEMPKLVEVFRSEIERGLPDLFFGQQDAMRGIYGDLSRMFTFRKSDFEPFPIYVVPEFLASELEKAVRRELTKLLQPTIFPNRLRTVLASLAFFYGRTSGGSGDAQSFPNFVEHLVNAEDYDGLLDADDVSRAFNVASVTKPAIKQSLDEATYSVEGLRLLIIKLVQVFHASIDSGSAKWLLGYLHKSQKFVKLSVEEYLDILLSNTQLGPHQFSKQSATDGIQCRLCSTASAVVVESYVTTGLTSFKFDNQSIRRQAEKACAKCALYSYLSQRLLGSEMVPAGGKLPQVPKTYNLIFHYGTHTDEEVDHLTSQIDLIWTLIRKHREAEQVRYKAAEHVRSLKGKFEREKDTQKKLTLEGELTHTEIELREAQASVEQTELNLEEAMPWLQEGRASAVPAENPSLDVLANIQLSESKVERHVLGLGMSGYRMILFVLPQIRPPRDAKEHDFAQRRFSNSRVTVTALLSFLRQLCGCDGPFYYQSLPTLTPDAFRRDTFYIRNERISVQRAEKEYDVITQLAWKLVWERGSDGLVRKVVLAEKLLADPLATFATVMRDSAILGQTKGSYKRLGGTYRGDWRAFDLTEYGRFIQKLSKLQEGT